MQASLQPEKAIYTQVRLTVWLKINYLYDKKYNDKVKLTIGGSVFVIPSSKALEGCGRYHRGNTPGGYSRGFGAPPGPVRAAMAAIDVTESNAFIVVIASSVELKEFVSLSSTSSRSMWLLLFVFLFVLLLLLLL